MSSSTESHITNYDQSKYWIAPAARNVRSSTRQHLQHYLIQSTIGYLLAPAIESYVAQLPASQPLKVVDLACGNGVWLTDVHTHLTAKHPNVSLARLDGFDINPTHFPHAAHLPSNVSLQQLDILSGSFPADLHGTYDVVHIRAFGSVMTTSELSPVLAVAMKLLKPGGYFQWDELRGDQFTAESPSPEHVSKAACDAVIQVCHGGLQAKGHSNAWVDVLDTHLTQFGFRDAQLFTHDKRKQDYKGWTEDYLMIWEEISHLFPPSSQAPNAPVTREVWDHMLQKAIEETERGVAVHQRRVRVAVGQKPQ
ncbi:S-adenosyl-L-methionine-dependent methyltransferase [Xylariomycetidae sp. FL2044]|nr:S-adenosyl-L-methionine-dependent methyltransferase [Xylariomycetidae sp. FL2044]